jgi:hypothetical protein
VWGGGGGGGKWERDQTKGLRFSTPCFDRSSSFVGVSTWFFDRSFGERSDLSTTKQQQQNGDDNISVESKNHTTKTKNNNPRHTKSLCNIYVLKRQKKKRKTQSTRRRELQNKTERSGPKAPTYYYICCLHSAISTKNGCV